MAVASVAAAAGVIALLFLGFAALAAGTYRQSRLLFGDRPSEALRRGLLGIGFTAIAVSLAGILSGPDVPRRLVEWFGTMTLAALVVVAACWVRDRV